MLKRQRKYFVGAFPFYNTQNTQLYSLIHCTSHIEGFKLYKPVAWKSFGGKSSTKDTHGGQYQLSFDFGNEGFLVPATDESCFFVTDIAKYLQKSFSGQKNVPLESLWQLLDYHPIFPSDGFRQEIRNELKNTYGAIFSTAVDSKDGKIRSNGEEGRWNISPEKLREIYPKGYVRLGKFVPNGMAIAYLKSGEQRKIETGIFSTIGRRKDGSMIESDTTEERVFLPGTQWDIILHNATYHGSQLLNKVLGEIRQMKQASGTYKYKRLDMSKSAVRDKVSHAQTSEELNHLFDTDGFFV